MPARVGMIRNVRPTRAFKKMSNAVYLMDYLFRYAIKSDICRSVNRGH